MPQFEIRRNIFPAGIYLLKVNNRNTRARCEVCSKLKMKTFYSLILQLEVANHKYWLI